MKQSIYFFFFLIYRLLLFFDFSFFQIVVFECGGWEYWVFFPFSSSSSSSSVFGDEATRFRWRTGALMISVEVGYASSVSPEFFSPKESRRCCCITNSCHLFSPEKSLELFYLYLFGVGVEKTVGVTENLLLGLGRRCDG